MPDTLSVEIKASLNWLWEEALDLSTLVDSSRLEVLSAFSTGSSAGEADQLWHDSRTIGAASNDDLDLTDLTQTVHGQSVSLGFASIKAILIQNTSTTAGDKLVLDSSVTNGVLTPFNGSASSKLEIPADSPLLLVNRLDGWTVTAGTGDLLRISNPGAESIDYKIVILGVAD